jgi:hypothetical protein
VEKSEKSASRAWSSLSASVIENGTCDGAQAAWAANAARKVNVRSMMLPDPIPAGCGITQPFQHE